MAPKRKTYPGRDSTPPSLDNGLLSPRPSPVTQIDPKDLPRSCLGLSSAWRPVSQSKLEQLQAVESDEGNEDDIRLKTLFERRQHAQVTIADKESDDDIPLNALSKRRRAAQTVLSRSDDDNLRFLQQQPPPLRADSCKSGVDSKVSLKSLPIEIHQEIVEYLPTDKDVVNYARTSQRTASSITSSVWRQRFIKTFDMIEGLTPDELSIKYAFRMVQSRQWIVFDLKRWSISQKDRRKQIEKQRWCLDMLRELILQSNAFQTCDKNGNETIVARNMQFIRNLISEGTPNFSYLEILDAVLNTDNDWYPDSIPKAREETSLVMLIQLCLTSISLDPTCCNNKVSHFDMSQAQVYAAPHKQPIFQGEWKQDINVRWLLHTVNFFKHHVKAGNGEGLFEYSYSGLKPHQLPQQWLGMITSGTQKLKSYWKGIQTFIPVADQRNLRIQSGTCDNIFPDETEGAQSFQDLTFYFNDENFSAADWPKDWERVLKGNPFHGKSHITISTSSRKLRCTSSRSTICTPKRIAAPEAKHFYGTSRGPRTAHFFGCLHALPAQGPPGKKIHGFQRITLMKFYTSDDSLDPNGIWAYEGCVLPGGNIIAGRWWDANADPSLPDQVYSGPFMFWNVEKSVAEPTVEDREALDFLLANYDQIMIR